MKRRFTFLLCLLCWATGTASLYAQDITNGLVSRYTFTGNSNDTFGPNPLAATLPRTQPTLTPDRCNNTQSAYLFDGVNDILINNAPTNVVNANYTYSAWVRVDQLPTQGIIGNQGGMGTILAIGNRGDNGDQVLAVQNNYLGVQGNTGFAFGGYGTGYIATGALPTLGQWYFLAVTVGPDATGQSQLTAYVDGVQFAQIPAGPPNYHTNTVLTIGGRHTNASIQFLNGAIDDVRIYQRALTACEVALLYRQNPQTQTVAIPDTQTNPIAGPASVCPGTTQTYSITPLLNPCLGAASAINWSLPAGATLVSGQGTNTVTVNFDASFTGGAITVAENIGVNNVSGCLAPRSLIVSANGSSCSNLNVTFPGNTNSYVGNLHDIVVRVGNTSGVPMTVTVTPVANPLINYLDATPRTVTVSPGRPTNVVFSGIFTQAGPVDACFTVSSTNSCTGATCSLQVCQRIQALAGCPASWSEDRFNCDDEVYGMNSKTSTLSVHSAFFNVTSIDFSFSYNPNLVSFTLPVPPGDILVPNATLSNVQNNNGQFSATLTFASKIDILTGDGDGDPVYDDFIRLSLQVLAKPALCFLSTTNTYTTFNSPAGSVTRPTDPIRVNFSGRSCDCEAPNADFNMSATSVRMGVPVTFTAVRNEPGDLHFWRMGEYNNRPLATTVSPVTYTFTAPGEYTISHTIQTADGRVATVVKTIIVLGDNYGLIFHDPTQTAQIPNQVVYQFGTGDFTLELQVKANRNNLMTTPVMLARTNELEAGLLLGYVNYANSADYGKVYIKLTGAAAQVNTAGISLLDGDCHHVAVVKRNNEVTFYIDGTRGTTFTHNGSTDLATAWQLGRHFMGQIGDVRIWNVARTQPDLVAQRDRLILPTTTGLIGYWRLEEESGQTLVDQATTNNAGVLGYTNASETTDPERTLMCGRTAWREAATQRTSAAVEQPTTREFYIYPNPQGAGASITLATASGEAQVVGVTITDLNGQVVYRGKVTTGDMFRWDQGLPSGVYVVHVAGGPSLRLVKE